MKKHFFYPVLLCLLCSFFTELTAQMSIGIKPYSSSEAFKAPQSPIPLAELPPPNMQKVAAEDAQFGWSRFAVPIPVHLDIQTAGEWTQLKNGDKIWRLKIRAKGAQGLMLQYADFQLPAEALLHLYNPDKTKVLGAFSSINNTDGGTFATDMIDGEALILEYYHPADCEEDPRLHIEEVSYVYRIHSTSRDVCNLGINCPEGMSLEDEKKGVVRIRMKFNNGQFSATGVILNNTNEDGIPYVLTSYNRLLEPLVLSNSVAQYENFIFYFNEEQQECNSGGLPNNSATMTGCIQVAYHLHSDYLLLRINGEIPDAPHDPRYLGWNWTPTPPNNLKSIYQANSGFKELAISNGTPSVYTENLITPAYEYPPNSFYKITWDNGHTEEGGQGGPILDSQGNVRGFVTVPEECGASEVYAGILNEAWKPGNVPQDQLGYWLDPAGLNHHQLNGLHITSPGGGGCGGSGGGCLNSPPIEQANAAVLGNIAKFISAELNGNYKILEKAYIENQAAIEEALDSEMPKYQAVQAAMKAVAAQSRKTFFRAFIFEKENKVTPEGLAASRRLLRELSKVIPTKSFQEAVNQTIRLMEVAKGKDLKSALIAFDRAALDELPFEEESFFEGENPLQLTIAGNPSRAPVAHFNLPETGRVKVELYDLQGKQVAFLLDEQRGAGAHYLPITPAHLTSEVLLIRITFYGLNKVWTETKKIVLW